MSTAGVFIAAQRQSQLHAWASERTARSGRNGRDLLPTAPVPEPTKARLAPAAHWRVQDGVYEGPSILGQSASPPQHRSPPRPSSLGGSSGSCKSHPTELCPPGSALRRGRTGTPLILAGIQLHLRCRDEHRADADIVSRLLLPARRLVQGLWRASRCYCSACCHPSRALGATAIHHTTPHPDDNQTGPFNHFPQLVRTGLRY